MNINNKKDNNKPLQKIIALSGIYSRRQAEDLIKQGQVILNGKKAEAGARASFDDEIFVNGKKINSKNTKLYIKLNKPRGYVCTNRAFKEEKNIFSLVDIKEKLFIAGRLDKDSRGLLLLTNDGDLTQKLTHPSFQHEKEYIVEIQLSKNIDNIIEKLKIGVDIGKEDGIVYFKKIEYLGENKFSVVLTQGKKRQIRRMFAAVKCNVIDLTRIRISNLKLDDLKEGTWKYINKEAIN